MFAHIPTASIASEYNILLTLRLEASVVITIELDILLIRKYDTERPIRNIIQTVRRKVIMDESIMLMNSGERVRFI